MQHLSGPFALLQPNVIFTFHGDSDEGIDVATFLQSHLLDPHGQGCLSRDRRDGVEQRT